MSTDQPDTVIVPRHYAAVALIIAAIAVAASWGDTRPAAPTRPTIVADLPSITQHTAPGRALDRALRDRG